MFVRTASPKDIEAVRDLLVETWHATYDAIHGPDRVASITGEWHSVTALQARLARPNSEFLVADDGTRIGGMAFATSVEDGEAVMVHQLYVLPQLQGQGIGTMLLDEIESCFPGAGKVRVEVEEANRNAISFYVAQGFAKAGSGKSELPGGPSVATGIYERPIVWAD